MNNIAKEKQSTPKDNQLASNLRLQIKTRMESLGINVRALERKAGLNVGSVNNILNSASANPTAETLNALATAFGCSIDELLSRKNNQVNTYENFQSYAWSSNLFSSIVTELNKQIKERNLTISSEKALYIIQEVYLYSLKKNKENAESSLVEWLLDKSL